MHAIILFDGVCNLCNQSVQFIISRDPSGFFRFASIQSEIGKELIRKHGEIEDIDSIILLENQESFLKSDAVIRISSHLKGGYSLLRIFQVIPRPIRDRIYDIIAKNRYKWFGRRNSCMIPTEEISKRFL